VDLFGLTVPYFMIIFIVATIIFDLVMKRTRLGKHIYAVGSNEVSARLSGINVDAIKTVVFMITGLMCGIAALLYASRTTAVAASNAGLMFELDAIAAVAIGGTAMAGGRGKIWGTFLGVLMFSIIRNILTAADVSTFLNGAISGAIIVIAVLLQNFNRRRG
jgi:ribose transport system permease protein